MKKIFGKNQKRSLSCTAVYMMFQKHLWKLTLLDIRTNKISLSRLEEILRWIGKESEADRISNLIVD